MLLKHASPCWNADSILTNGICTRYSQGKERKTWFHVPKMTRWARSHVAKRHGCKVSEVVVFTVLIPDAHVQKFRDGVFTLDRDLTPEFIVTVHYGSKVTWQNLA